MLIYGVDYYPEHWNERFWDRHIGLMKQYGIDWVRIGEFAWSVVEPREGEYDFSIFDKAISKLKENGIKVILGTPTATPPAWLVRKFPEILPVDFKGKVREFGSRRHYTPNSKVYRDYSAKITEEYAKRYGNVVDLWQIDNEFGCHETTYSFTESDRKAFIEWLKNRYVSLDALNKTWGSVFWSQIYSDWEEIVFPINTPTFENPHQLLDIFRFMSDSSIDFMNMQIKIIRAYSDKPITHNFMVDFMDLDYKKMSEYLDFVSWDNYIATEEYDPLRQSANHTLMRSLKKKPFLVIEQQPGRVNWREVNDNYSADYLGMWVKQSYVNGAMGVMPFRYDQIRFAAEQYHGGLLDYAGRVSKRLEIYKIVRDETEDVVEPNKEVAIYFDYENEWIHRINHVNRKFKYWNSIVDVFKAIRMLGYNVDFVFPNEHQNLNDYRILVVPYAFKIDQNFVEAIKKFEGIVVMTCMSNLKDENNWIVERAPKDLIEEFGVEVMDFGAIREEKGNVFNEDVNVGFWKDEIELCGAEVVGTFKDGAPLLTVKGSRYYVASVLDTKSWKSFFVSSGLLKPKFIGLDVEFTSSKEKTFILNLKPCKNVLYVGTKRFEFSPFELRKL